MSKINRRISGKDGIGIWWRLPKPWGIQDGKSHLPLSDKAPAVLCRVFCVPTVGTETRLRGKVGGEERRWVRG